MQGSMRWVVAVIATILSLVIGLSVTAVSEGATTRSSCSDLSYLNSAVKAAKKNVSAWKLAEKARYSAGLTPARQSLWIIKHSAEPCDDDYKDYWLHRQYSIKYSVAMVRYFEQMARGDHDAADITYVSVEFWGDSKNDISNAW